MTLNSKDRNLVRPLKMQLKWLHAPLQYFSRFWDDNFFKHVEYHTNLYSTQQTGKSIETMKKKLNFFWCTDDNSNNKYPSIQGVLVS